MKTEERVEVTLESTLASVDVGEEAALRFAAEAGFSEEDAQKIGMAVRESIANAVIHGNRYDRGRKAMLRLELEEGRLIVTVTDQGEGFDMSKIPDPLAPENLLQRSGRGIFLIRAFMEEVQVRRLQPRGTEVRMVKYPSVKKG